MNRSASLVQQIRRLVDGHAPDAASGLGLAETYAAQCRDANARLRRCHAFLKKGMRPSALADARQDPDLLEQCATLDFIGVERWHVLCRDQHWPAAEPLEADAISALNDAYASSESMKDLEAEWHRLRMKRKGQATVEAVQVLRELVERDPGNPVWADNLRGYEDQRLKELRVEFVAASAAGDRARTETILLECQARWLVPADEALLADVSARVRQLREDDALEQGRQIAEEVWSAYAARHLERTGRAVAKYRDLLHGGYFKPDADLQRQFEEAQEWFDEQDRLEKEERQFQDTLATVQQELERPHPSRDFARLWLALGRFSRPIPDQIDARARVVIEQIEMEEKRARLLRVAVCVVTLGLVTAGTAVGFTLHHRAVQKATWCTELSTAYDDVDLDRFDTILQGIEKQSRDLYGHADIQHWAARRAEIENALATRRRTATEAVAALEAVRDKGFEDSPVYIDKLIADAKAACSEPEEKGRVGRVISEWEAHKTAQQVAVDRSLRDIVDQATAAFAKVSAQTPDAPNAARQQLGEVKRLISQGENLRAAAPELRTQLASLRDRVEHAEAVITSREKLLEAMAGARDFGAYLLALKTYVTAFPEDALTPKLKTLLDLEKDYSALPVLGPVSGPVLDNFYCPSVVAAAEKVDTANPFWYAAYAEMLTYRLNTATQAAEVITAIAGLGNDKQLVALSTFDLSVRAPDGAVEAKHCYVEGPFTDKFSKINGVATLVSRSGKTYEPSATDRQPQFRNAIYSKQRCEVSAPTPMPHTTLVLNLTNAVDDLRGQNAAMADFALAGMIEQAAADKRVDALLRLRLVSLLIDQLLLLTGDEGMEPWKAARTELGAVDPNLSWLCALNQEVIDANAESARLLQRHVLTPELPLQYRFGVALRRASLTRGVTWVGFASLDEEPRPLLKLPRGRDASREVWALRPNAEGNPEIQVAIDLSQARDEAILALKPGEPLFAPTDGRTAAALLADVCQKTGWGTRPVPAWPAGWPVNRRP